MWKGSSSSQPGSAQADLRTVQMAQHTSVPTEAPSDEAATVFVLAKTGIAHHKYKWKQLCQILKFLHVYGLKIIIENL